MSKTPEVVILCGGVSSEREVSLRSGAALERALGAQMPVRLLDLKTAELPASLKAQEHVVFPALHGAFGEDGQLQSLLEQEGFAYAGSDARSSQLCMHKTQCKDVVQKQGVPVLKHKAFRAGDSFDVEGVLDYLGHSLIVKPDDSGSSVGLHVVAGRDQFLACIDKLDTGNWIVEPRFVGRELTVGLLDGKAMGVVEIVSDSGIYDYDHKYRPGQTQYRVPAPLESDLAEALKAAAQTAFSACGCRDFARADFLLNDSGSFIFLEINTIPGLTDTSLLPKSASCVGLDFMHLCKCMVEPAIDRYKARVFD